MLTVHLAQDENDCFSAWVSAKEVGLMPEEGDDSKVNYGQLLLQALLENWPRPFQLGDEAAAAAAAADGCLPSDNVNHHAPSSSSSSSSATSAAAAAAAANGSSIHRPGNDYYTVPPHTPVIFRYRCTIAIGILARFYLYDN